MTTLVSYNLNGACIPLAIGMPVTTGAGPNTATYTWGNLWAMTDAQLNAMSIYRVSDTFTIPTGQIQTGVVYEYTNNSISATPLYSTAPTIPVVVVTLPTYAEQKQQTILASGITVNVANTSAPLNILCDGTPPTLGLLGLFALFGQLNPTGTKTWLDNNGVSTLITGTECISLATQIGDWSDNMYATLGTVLSEITANTITTKAEIDAVVWPTS